MNFSLIDTKLRQLAAGNDEYAAFNNDATSEFTFKSIDMFNEINARIDDDNETKAPIVQIAMENIVKL